MRKHVVIAGAGVAGGVAAATLRQEGSEDRITLIGAEPHFPYERPALSKQFLTHSKELDDLLIKPGDFYQDNEIEVLLTAKATRIDPYARLVELDNHELLPFDDLLIATGGSNRRLPIPGTELDGVVQLRSLNEAADIRMRALHASRAVIVGMGFIGCEVAASLRTCGLEVVGIEVFKTPLYAAVGEEIGRIIESIHRDSGVELICDDQVVEIRGLGRAAEVITRNGKVVGCDLVVVGTGVEPLVELALGCGLEVDNGIIVDEYCETSLPHIWAAGDVANQFHPLIGRRIRVEHFQNAVGQGAAVARSMLGKRRPYDQVPWFWSDQFEHSIQQTGFHGAHDKVIVRGNADDRRVAAFYLSEGVIQSVVTINMSREIRKSTKLIAAQKRIRPTLLEDEEVDLRDDALLR